MLPVTRVVSLDRFHLRKVTRAVLAQFDAVVVFDSEPNFNVDKTPGSLGPDEEANFVDYNYNGRPLILLCAGWKDIDGARQTVVSEILSALKVGVTVSGDAWRVNGPATRLKNGSLMKISGYSDEPNLNFSTSYYPKYYHVRTMFGQQGGRECAFAGLLTSKLAVDDPHPMTPSGGDKLYGSWINMIVHDNYNGGEGNGTENIRQLIWDPTHPQGADSAAPEGSHPGRIVLDGCMQNFLAGELASTGQGQGWGDQLRMLAHAILWANYGNPPSSVLFYNTNSWRLGDTPGVTGFGPDDMMRSFPERERAYGIGTILEDYLSLPLESITTGE